MRRALFLLSLLLGCDGATEDKPGVDDSVPSDDSGEPQNVSGLTLADAGLCEAGAPSARPGPGTLSGVTDSSPFGTGDQPGLVLGALSDLGAVPRAPNASTVDYGLDLDSETFDLYIPPAYDGSEPYGVVAFINAGDNGGLNGQWRDAMDAQKLIWVGGRGVGNSQYSDRRMGMAVLGASRALELFNVDTDRVYITGTSGGARVATVAAMLHPQLFRSAFPLCGSAYHREVEQAYETREPDSHYEFWGSAYYPQVEGVDFAEWLRPFNQRFALMTSFEDFREGDMMNIYHHGFEADGWEARLLEVAGGHCATSPEHIEDALAFVQHPLFERGEAGWADGSTPESASAALDGDSLQLEASGSGVALALLRDRVHWQDAEGAVVRAALTPQAGSAAALGLWAWDDAQAVDSLAGAGPEQAPGLVVQLGSDGVVSVFASGVGGARALLLEGTPEDWSPGQELPLKLQLWQQELQLDVGAHVPGATLGEGAKLMHDNRTLRVRWSDLPQGWVDDTWSAERGAVLTVSGWSPEQAEVSVQAQVRVIDALGMQCGE